MLAIVISLILVCKAPVIPGQYFVLFDNNRFMPWSLHCYCRLLSWMGKRLIGWAKG